MARQTVTRRPAPPARRPAPARGRVQPRKPRQRIDAQLIRDKAEAFLAQTFTNQSREFNMLLGLTLVLTIFGLTMVLSSSAVDSVKTTGDVLFRFGRQLVLAIVGLALMVGVIRVGTTVIFRFAPQFFLGTLVLQGLTFLPGIGMAAGNNRSWIAIGKFSFQPAELTKIALIILLAVLLVEREGQGRNWRYPVLSTVAIPILAALALIAGGQDLGTTGIVSVIILGMLWLAGITTQELKVPLLGAGVVGLIYVAWSGSRIPRIYYWLNPGADIGQIYTYQPTHGKWALAGGSLFGVGLGNSKIKWSWLPEAENDFIFAVIGEELGLIGAVAVVLAFVAMAVMLFNIYKRTPDPRKQLVVAGVLIYLVFQAMVNIAVVAGLAPVLGVPLPLISAGGSSIVSSLIAVGLALAIERENHAAGVRSVPAGRRRPTR